MKAKRLVLGSALWGWTVIKEDVFSLLDRYVERGGTWIDTAVNYPINQAPADYGKALSWLDTWLLSRGPASISIILKVGAVDNMGSPLLQLAPQNLTDVVDEWKARFGEALRCVSIHWDNRGSGLEDRSEIRETLSALTSFWASGLEVGFSGVSYPEIYVQEAPQLAKEWWVQVKENYLTCEARNRLQLYFPDARYLAYGINMGGIQLGAPNPQSSVALRGVLPSPEVVTALEVLLNEAQTLHPAPADFNELAMRQAFFNPALSGIIVGPRTSRQLDSTMAYWEALERSASAPDGE
jgi:aryl-alcohol dehydrogenase-like predicted oxidoreductase